MASDRVSFTAVVTSHGNPGGLARILGNLHYQTRRPDETLVLVSGVSRGEFCRVAEHFPWAQFFLEDDREDWGHAKRAAGLGRASGEWVGFFNDDDSYELDYVERMLSAGDGADVVFCGWNEQPECSFNAGSSTSGNFIARTVVALDAGYPASAVYENDGVFIDRLRSRAERVARVDGVLYHHNYQ